MRRPGLLNAKVLFQGHTGFTPTAARLQSLCFLTQVEVKVKGVTTGKLAWTQTSVLHSEDGIMELGSDCQEPGRMWTGLSCNGTQSTVLTVPGKVIRSWRLLQLMMLRPSEVECVVKVTQ